MEFTIDHDLHLHSFLSTCSSDPVQTPQFLLEYAEKNNLKTLCLTDHVWDNKVPCEYKCDFADWYAPQTFEHIKQSLPLPQSKNVRFLFGAETEMDMCFNLAMSPEAIEQVDFLIVPTTHMHMDGLTLMPGITNPEVRAQIWCDRFAALLQKDLPWHKVGIAHLTCVLTCPPKGNKEGLRQVLRAVPDLYLERLFEKAAKLGVGIELNFNSFFFSDEEFFRPYIIAKKHGCKFYMGSDAHHPDRLVNMMENFRNIARRLDLTEDDKFIIGA